jgi:molybdopterin-containing oxidoreductase family iron-sulfur binding subunit
MQTVNDETKLTDLSAIRESLAAKHGKTYWRSLNELAETEDFARIVRTEFPRQAQFMDGLDRRDFLKVLGASLAFAGLTACIPQQSGQILPYSQAPESIVPGKPIYFASTMPRSGYGVGVLVRSETGRPIKVDGNPRHPGNNGSSDVFMQASILDLYDPDRASKVSKQGVEKSWQDFAVELTAQNGPNLHILTETMTSPSLTDEIHKVLEKFPQGKWHQYSPLHLTNGTLTEVFGQPLGIQYRFDKAQVILSLDSDFLFREPGSLRYARDFGTSRKPGKTMSRLYVVESGLSLTGSNADHRLPVRSSDVESFARALANRMGIIVDQSDMNLPGQDWMEALVIDLQSAQGNAIVIPGERQPAIVHAIAQSINQAIGAVNKTVIYTNPVETNPTDQLSSLKDLVQALEAGQVDTLLILGGNPVYTAPADLAFMDAIKKAKFSAYLGTYQDETASLTTWHIPAAHYLEAWGDLKAYDGTTGIIQPLIEPLYNGKSPHEVLAILLGQSSLSGYELVRQYWKEHLPPESFETIWNQALQDGYLPDTMLTQTTQAVTINPELLNQAHEPALDTTLEVVYEPDPTIWDGHYSNNAWLQELPKPITKLTWDNAALISPALAAKYDLKDEDVIHITVRGRGVNAPVIVQPGQADNSITLTLGYGRQAGGKVLEGAGFNAYDIRSSEAPWFDTSAEIRKTGMTFALAITQGHQTMEGRDLIREATLAEYEKNPKFAQSHEDEKSSLYNPVAYPGHAWGMSINLGSCIGCNACILACQAENNIPTVGKDQVRRSREMHWLRVDRYYQGMGTRPKVSFEPIPCMHCEQAPCETVCPVEATSHSAEGINEMTYNRCVGTRYCGNNCPYKVRRFNFYKYADDKSPAMKAMHNPDVSIRMRGVMEKCTYCVQRVNAARIQSEVSGQPILDGEVRTACQQACPTNAIVFGDLNDVNSQVRQLKETPLNYALLGELGTKPRTTYMAKITNPNPAILEQA